MPGPYQTMIPYIQQLVTAILNFQLMNRAHIDIVIEARSPYRNMAKDGIVAKQDMKQTLVRYRYKSGSREI
jgi:hypothetical protein